MRYGHSLQAAALLVWALHANPAPLSAGETAWVDPPTGIEFISIPGGTFTMGTAEGRDDERPPHEVRIGDFSIGRYEVTQRQWRKVMGTNPSHFTGCDDCPVEQVSWEDVQVFLRRAGEIAGFAMRLPTEGEWEYAAGGGAAHQVLPGTDILGEAAEFSWYSGSFAGKTRPVGRKIPNAFGASDMGGNVGEWCADWYGGGFYGSSPVDNPTGPERGDRRVVRGGSWVSGPADTRVARRSGRSPDTRSRTIGFRVAADGRSPSPP